jgi:hypothetical protein
MGLLPLTITVTFPQDLGHVWFKPKLAQPMRGRAKILAQVSDAHALPIRGRKIELPKGK